MIQAANEATWGHVARGVHAVEDGPMETLTTQLIDSAPTIVMFVVVVLTGLLVAALLRRMVVWAVGRAGIEQVGDRLGVTKALGSVGIGRGIGPLLGGLAWLVVVLVTLAAATEVLGLNSVTQALGRVVALLPRLLVAALVVVGGAALATLLRSVVRRASRKDGELDSPSAVGSLLYYIVLVVSVLLAADQAGLQTDLADGLVMICVSLALAGVALAFALGSKDAFGNMVAGHYLQRLVQPGDEIEIAGERGVVLRFSPVAIVLRTERGQKIVPTRSLLDGTIEVVASAGATAPEPER